MRKLLRHLQVIFWHICSVLWWRCRVLKARIHCWYIDQIWMPRHQVPKFTEEEQQAAAATIRDILQEIEEEERQCVR